MNGAMRRMRAVRRFLALLHHFSPSRCELVELRKPFFYYCRLCVAPMLARAVREVKRVFPEAPRSGSQQMKNHERKFFIVSIFLARES
jgi:hypothetical protein